MAVAIEFQQVKDYAVNLASRAIGINYYLETDQADRVRKVLDGERRQGDREGGAALSMVSLLASASLRTREVAMRINNIDSAEKPSKFFYSLAKVGAGVVDIAPYSLAFVNPLLLAAKPIINAASHVVADIIEARLIKEDRLPPATEGTYRLLEKASKRFYDPKLGGGIIRDSEGNLLGTLVKERVCAIGGSCMELRLIHQNQGEKWFDVTHITKGDRIVNISRMGSTPEEIKQTPLEVGNLTSVVVAA